MTKINLTGQGLTPGELVAIARDEARVQIDPPAIARMAEARAIVLAHLESGKPVYGLNTGLGSRVTHNLTNDVLAEFSRLTLVGRSNAVGPPLPQAMVRALMAVRLNGLLQGGAGADPRVAEALAAALMLGCIL